LRASPEFTGRGLSFWSCVKSISQGVRYTKKGTDLVLAPSREAIIKVAEGLGFEESHLKVKGEPSPLVEDLHNYFAFRAERLNDYVRPRLMVLSEAQALFAKYHKSRFVCPLPLNKQKGEKAGFAYFTCTINKIIAEHADGCDVDWASKHLPTVVQNGRPVGTLSRHVDGCFPNWKNPIAVWEIEEYYHTTSFGSRVADGIYESLLDGIELRQISQETGAKIEHLLMLDAKDTWWKKGKSYLCRVIDMLHMGYVDEVLFGREIEERLPSIVKAWVYLDKASKSAKADH
jgi:hypothetical protein